MPSTSAGRPSRRAARSTSPARKRSLIRLDETPSTSGTGRASKPRRSSRARSPARARPKRKFAPATTTSVPIGRRTASANSSGPSCASSRSNSTTSTSAIPAWSTSSRRRARLESSCTSYPNAIRGCGSKVTSVGVSPAASAASSTRRWPRCTPSKVPTATARGSDSRAPASRTTFMQARRSGPAPPREE